MNLTLREILDRYGPTLAVVAVLALVGLVLPGNADRSSGIATSGPVAGPAAGAPVAGGPVGGTGTGAALTAPTGGPGGVGTGGGVASPVGGGPSGSQGGGPTPGVTQPPPADGGPVWRPEHGPGNFPAPTPDTVCREDGALPGLHLDTPACVPIFDGDNGGATAQGVTADEILIVRYRGPANPATTATLQAIGADDPPEIQERTDTALWRYFATHWETYGREPRIVIYDAAGSDEAAQRAAAVDIAQTLKPFAVWGAPDAAAEELAARGIICACTVSLSRSFYARTSPYIWSTLPVAEEYYEHIAEYIGKRLAGKPAAYAGTNVRVSNDVRKFGLVFYEGANGVVDPDRKVSADYFERILAERYGVRLSAKVGYIFDIQQQQQQSLNIISQMVAAGVNNIICACDPLYPIFLTSEATRQQWYPEWFITGTALTDTTFFGRTYDQAQWTHAFGISPLPVFWSDVSTSSGYQAVHHMIPELQRGDEGVQVNVRQAPIQILATGIHYAGPRLTPETFAQGMLSKPPTGGTPKLQRVYYTLESPTSVKDFTEIYWVADRTGVDETGKDAPGILMKANGGKRYEAGQWPQADPFVWDNDPAPIYTTDDPPSFLPHGVPGHTHDLSEPCRSCPGGTPPGRIRP